MKTHIAINGAGGRMGQRLVALAKDDARLQVVAAIDSPSSPRTAATWVNSRESAARRRGRVCVCPMPPARLRD